MQRGFDRSCNSLSSACGGSNIELGSGEAGCELRGVKSRSSVLVPPKCALACAALILNFGTDAPRTEPRRSFCRKSNPGQDSRADGAGDLRCDHASDGRP